MSNIFDIYLKKIKKYADSPLLIEGENELNYREFHTLVKQYQSNYDAEKVTSNSRLALSCSSASHLYAALFASMSKNACAALINPKSPKQTQDASARLSSPTHFYFDLNQPTVASSAPTKESLTNQIILFTSGSTGTPKGVCLDSSALIYNALKASDQVNILPCDRLLLTTSPYFTSSICHFLSVFLKGASLVINEGFQLGDTLVKLIDHYECSIFGGAPSHFIQFVESTEHKPRSLKKWISSGAATPTSIIKKSIHKFPDLDLFIMYGLTEMAGRLTILDLSRAKDKIGSVGLPLPGYEVEVRDNSNKECPTNISGNIHVKGRSILQGYLSENGLNLKKGSFCTGDVGYFDSDGYLWIEGRNDDIFKSGGEKVAPSFVEDCLLQTGLFKEVLVVPQPHPILGNIAKAFVVLKKKDNWNQSQCIALLRQMLPTAQIPKIYQVVDSLLKTGSGKIKKNQTNHHSVECHH